MNRFKFKRMVFLSEDDGGAGGAQPPEEHGEEGKEAPAYFSQFKKENRERFQSLYKYKSLDELADAALKGDNVKEPDYTGYLKIPTKESTKEELRDFMTKLGVPEGPDKYGIPKEEGQTESMQSVEKVFREAAYKSGMSDSQAKSMWGVLRAVTDTAVKQYEDAQKERVDGFDKRFEDLFSDTRDSARRSDAMKENLGYFRSFLTDTGLGQVLKETGAIYDERIVKAIGDYQKRIKGRYRGGTDGPEKGERRIGVFNYGPEFEKEYGGR